MQRHLAMCGQRVQDRLPHQLVAKHQLVALGCQQPGFDASVETRWRSRYHLLEQPRVNAWTAQRGRLQDRRSRCCQARQARQQRVANGDRHPGTWSCQNLAYEERIAARPTVQLVDIQATAHRHLANRFQRQRREINAYDRSGDQISQSDAKRVTRTDLIVAIRCDQ